MNICFIGKHQYPKDIFSNDQDMKTWRSLALYFKKIFIIAESPDLFFHRAKEKNINIYLIPNIFGYAGFIIGAVKLGFYLSWRYGIDAFDASEIAGGGITATILRFFTGKSVIIEVQGEIFREPISGIRGYILKKIGRFTMKRASRIRVISNAIFSQAREQGIDENKIYLVSLRVDLTLFNPNRFGESIRQTDTFGDKMGITLGYIGRLVNGKGLEDLFEAIKILKNWNSELPEWKLIIYGNGPLERKLKKLAEKLRIEDKIEWQGFVFYGKVPEALVKMDIFIYPSWHEGFGRSIMEALAMEKAVVAANVGGIPDLIRDGENGFLIEPNNPKMLAEKIKELMENKELRKKFGKAGKKWVSENFEWNQGIKKFANLFLELEQ